MKVKTSVTLSPQTLQLLDQFAAPGLNRSRLIELAVLEYVKRRMIEEREARDLEILDRSAEELNQEVKDVLAYQVVP